jgi:hypothetical protein
MLMESLSCTEFTKLMPVSSESSNTKVPAGFEHAHNKKRKQVKTIPWKAFFIGIIAAIDF